MNEQDRPPEEQRRPRTTQEIIDGMPTPTDAAGAFALFAALELQAMETGASTPDESARVLRQVFGTSPEQG